jgi:hypothetical protein
VFRDQVLDEAGARHDRRAEGAGEVRVHVATLAPAGRRVQQAQADPIVEHMRRRVGLHMQRTPERDARGGAVGGGVDVFGLHVVLPFWPTLASRMA